MRSVFADADYWVALLHPHEQLHEQAKEISARLQPVRIVTSEMVLAEVLSILGGRGEHIRRSACDAVGRLREDPNVTVIPQTSTQFAEALSSFCSHRDKEMERNGLRVLRDHARRRAYRSTYTRPAFSKGRIRCPAP